MLSEWLLIATTGIALLCGFIWYTRKPHPPPSSPSPPLVHASRYGSISSSTRHTSPAQRQPPQPPRDPETRLRDRIQFTTIAAYRLMDELIRDGKLDVANALGCSIDDWSKLDPDSDSSILPPLKEAFPSYDPFDPTLSSLRHFQHVKMRTNCIFARKSSIVGSADIPAITTPNSAVEGAGVGWSTVEQTLRSVPGFIEFTLKVKDSYPVLKSDVDLSDPTSFFMADTKTILTWPTPLSEFKLDAFVFEIVTPMRSADTAASNDGGEAPSSSTITLAMFSGIIRDVLTTLSRCDPVLPRDSHQTDLNGIDAHAAQCMASIDTPHADEVFGSSRWHFRFLGESFFVTCFAPCYPKNHSRYQFCDEADDPAYATRLRQRCFVLFQPELAFLRYNLSPDTPHTNWSIPKTERDRIRVAFQQAGRPYPIPDTVAYPSAHFIVPPLEPFSKEVIRWWRKKESRSPNDQHKNERLESNAKQ